MTKLECVERECVSSVEPLRSRVEMRLSLVAGQANERVDQSTEVAVEALHFGFVSATDRVHGFGLSSVR